MKKLFRLLGLSLLFYQCGAKQNSLLSDVSVEKTFYPLQQCKAVQNIAPYIDKIEVVQLEATPKSMLGEVNKLLLRPDGAFGLLTHSGIMIFDAQGKFQARAGRIGHGPGEYLKLNDICLTADGQYILALSAFGTVLQYRADNGAYVKTIAPSPKLEYSCDGIAPGPGNGFYLYADNPANADDFDTPFDCLLRYDSEGKLTSQGLPRIDFGLQVAAITQSAGNSYILRPQEGDNIAYKTDAQGRFAPWVRIDFGDKAIPSGYVKKQGGSVWTHLQDFLRADYYKLPLYLEQTKNAFYFTAAGPEAQTHEFLCFTGTEKGIRWTKTTASATPFIIRGADDEWFYGLYDDPKTYDAGELAKLPPLKRYLIEQIGLQLTEDKNPPIVKIRFKTNE